MPYINKDRRDDLEPGIDLISKAMKENLDMVPVGESGLVAGDLNYIITRICHEYLRIKGKSYQSFNDIMGALSGSNQELYRTIFGPYEEYKRITNGRVSDMEG